MKRLTLLELNEFNTELLEEAARVMDAPHIARLLSLHRTEVTTDDIYADGSLEPWVQWVSMHTGVPYAEHGILHIGDVPDRGHPQIWERLSDHGISSGVWGVLNGARREAEHCRFFVPDPWTFSENTYPEALQGLIALPRFLAKNRLNVLQPEVVPLGAALARSFVRPSHLAQVARQGPRIGRQLATDVAKAYVYFTPYEYLSVRRFSEAKKRYDPQFSVVFLNMLAHAQHYYWDPRDLRENARMQYVLGYVDRALGHVFDALEPGEEIIATNGFEQFNLVGEMVHHVYRQRDHSRFLQSRLGLTVALVDAHMTNDAHLVCSTEEQLSTAVAALESVRVGEEPMFKLQRYADDPCKLFFQVRFGRPLPQDAVYYVGDRAFSFWEDFESLGVHTGRHGPKGTVFSTLPDMPDGVHNHVVLGRVMAHFGIEDWPELSAPLRTARIPSVEASA